MGARLSTWVPLPRAELFHGCSTELYFKEKLKKSEDQTNYCWQTKLYLLMYTTVLCNLFLCQQGIKITFYSVFRSSKSWITWLMETVKDFFFFLMKMVQKIWTIVISVVSKCWSHALLMHNKKWWKVHALLYNTFFSLFCPDCHFLKSDWSGTLDFKDFFGKTTGTTQIYRNHTFHPPWNHWSVHRRISFSDAPYHYL